MSFLLFETKQDKDFLLPLTYFRDISNIRIGIFKIYEKWERYLQDKAHIFTGDYLYEKYPIGGTYDLFIRSVFLPDKNLVKAVGNLKAGEVLQDEEGEIIAFRTREKIDPGKDFDIEKITAHFQSKRLSGLRKLTRPYDLIAYNAGEIVNDVKISGFTRTYMSNRDVHITGDYPVHIGAGTQLNGVYLDAREGPVFIGENVTILPFSYIKGPAAVMENSVVKAGTQIYEGTTLGPGTKAGGEIKNVLFFGNSNKGHDGYLGDSVVGEWCNFGAGTSNSNLKNNYSGVKMWHIASKRFEPTGRRFLGLVMGDFSKTAIHTRFNTGTVVGVASNIFTPDFPPKFVSSFNWGGGGFNHDHAVEKALETAKIVYARRGKTFTHIDEKIFREVYRLVRDKE